MTAGDPRTLDPSHGAEELAHRTFDRRWGLIGCFGCMGFLVLAALLVALGARQAVDEDAIWAQVTEDLAFDERPAGWRPLFATSFFDQRQAALVREADGTLLLLCEFSGRDREQFDAELDPALALEGTGLAPRAVRVLVQGRELEGISWAGEALDVPSREEQEEVSGLKALFQGPPGDGATVPAACIRLRVSDPEDNGGTFLEVNAPGRVEVDAAFLDELLAPFDLWGARLGRP